MLVGSPLARRNGQALPGAFGVIPGIFALCNQCSFFCFLLLA